MNSRQRRKDGKFKCQLIKTIGRMLTSDIKEWKKDPTITKEYIIKQLEKVEAGIKDLTNVKNLNSTNS